MLNRDDDPVRHHDDLSMARADVLDALRKSESRFNSFMDASAQGVWLVDTNGFTTFANRRMADLLGYNVDEIVGRQCFDFLHEADAERARSGFEKRMEGDTAARDYRVRRKDGAVIWVSFTAAPMRDEAGKAIGVLAMCIDVTEKVQAAEALRESEERQRLATDAGKIGLWDWDITTGRIVWSDRVYEFHGMELGSFGGSVEEFDRLIHKEDKSRVAEAITRSLQANEPYQIEFRIVRPTGEARWLATNGRVIRDSSGRPVRMLGAVMDMTDRQLAEEELRNANASLELANADLEQFAYAAAHDLREPVRNISLYLQLLERKYGSKLDGDARTYISVTIESARRIQELIHDLLAYTRVVEGPEPGRPGTLANQVVRDVISDLQTSVETLHAKIVCEELPEVCVPAGQLTQIFRNLIGNALKYRGADPPSIRIFAEPGEAGHWVFTVRDNGIGVAADQHDRIFKVFRRLHGREIPGTGIGLAICSRIIGHHGGRIWVESEPGCGAAFRFTLPVGHRVKSAKTP
jgi:PAS domain S-box-containing protein